MGLFNTQKNCDQMEIYREWLRDHNVSFQETPFGLLFRWQGGNFVIEKDPKDKSYLQLYMPSISEVTSANKGNILTIMNEVNNQIKCVKAVLKENDVWLEIEMFIDSTPVVEDFFGRLLDILIGARLLFHLKEMGER